MRLSLKWINELVNLKNIPLEILVEKLTLGGFEVEEILSLTTFNNPDTILDVSATANRADSLSTYGIGKEIGALVNTPLSNSPYSVQTLNSVNYLKHSTLKIKQKHNYSVFTAIKVENITSFTSPKWLQEKLINAGITPSNNISDYQHYVTLETGYPFEFYDLDKITKKLESDTFKLQVTTKNHNQTFLDAKTSIYNLNNNILTIKANDKLLSLAGVMSNADYLCDSSTNSLLIEGAIFNSKKIRQMSRILGLRTERSARYEKDLTVSDYRNALYRLLILLQMRNPNIKYTLHTIADYNEVSPVVLTLKYETIIQILGPTIGQNKNLSKITISEVSNYLTRLNFLFTFDKNKELWLVTISPSRTNDIYREIDLIEEIGRLHGFNNFVTFLPQLNKIGKKDFSYQTRQKLTTYFLNSGLSEVIQYSLVSNKEKSAKINLINPLLNDYGSLRQSLLPGLLRSLSHNLKNGNTVFEVFEYGHVFIGNDINNYKEIENIAGLFGNFKIRSDFNQNFSKISWSVAKGKIENIFDQLKINVFWKQCSCKLYENIFHQYRYVNIYLSNGTEVGYFGQVHPLLARQLNIEPNTYLFEFNFNTIKNRIITNQLTNYKKYSTYPKIVKDLSFIIKNSISYNEVFKIIKNAGTKLLILIEILDEYRGEGIPEDSTSLCFQLTFQSQKGTLNSKQIEKIIENIQLALTTDLQVLVRS